MGGEFTNPNKNGINHNGFDHSQMVLKLIGPLLESGHPGNHCLRVADSGSHEWIHGDL